MKIIDRFFRCFMNVCIWVAKLLLLAMTILVCISVFYRYILGRSITWSDEVSMLLMVWFGFISIAYGVKQKLHLSVELIYNFLPATLQRIFSKVTMAIVSILGILMAVYGVLLMQSTMNNVMAATRWPSATLYAVIPVSGILIAYFAFAQCIGYEEQEDRKGEPV